jgi:Transposase DDE domain
MIFADSLPFAKTFFATLNLPASSLALLTRLVVASLAGLHSAAAAATAVRSDPRHRAQLVRFLARQRWSDNWNTLEQLADLLVQSCQHEIGTWVFLLDQTYHTTAGPNAQNTFSRANKKPRPKGSDRRQKRTPRHACHCFLFGLLISPQTGTRLPCVRSYYTESYCRQRAQRATAQRPAPVFRTQADLAAEMIRDVRVPPGSRVLVLGDTAFEAKQIRAACQQRGFDWIVPANPERVLAGPRGRRRLREVSNAWSFDTLTRIELCPGLTDWWRHQRGSRDKAWRGKYGRLYWARAETLDVHNVGGVRVVFSTTKETKPGQSVSVQKVLLSNRTDWDARAVVSAYAVRWQIELFFKEMKSDLGLSRYRVRDFREVEGWVQACCVAFVYLEWYRLKRRAESERQEWWWRQRARGLALQALGDAEGADLEQIAEHLGSAESRRWLRERLRRALPREQRRIA